MCLHNMCTLSQIAVKLIKEDEVHIFNIFFIIMDFRRFWSQFVFFKTHGF